MSEEYYGTDLAYIHDVGFCDHVRAMSNALLPLLKATTRNELIIDLGCGSGVSTRAFSAAGFRTLGVDYSPAMIKLARQRDKKSTYVCGSFLEYDLPECRAVTAIGEVINYLFDPNNSKTTLGRFFGRVFDALHPGGLFLLDFAEPDRHAATTCGFREGEDWACLAQYQHDKRRQRLTRQIVSFRKVGKHYRRAEETHTQQLYKAAEVAKTLRKIGFTARIARRFGNYELPPGVAAIVARRPHAAD